jgi:hypothetical protein
VTVLRICAACDEALPLSAFQRHPGGRDGLRSSCRECEAARYAANAPTPEERRRRNLWTKYRLTPEAFDALLASQGGVCSICETDAPGARGWHVDHNHACCPGRRSCGECVRGLLCAACNKGLGLFRDDPEALRRAALYLIERTPA